MTAREMPRHAGRAAGVLAILALGALPAALGISDCPLAKLGHVACPGCGMTRAMYLLFRGDLDGSLRMHPLALPMVIATSLLMAALVWVTFTTGTPIELMKARVGRWAATQFVVVNVVVVAFWVLRMLGHFGGPVAI